MIPWLQYANDAEATACIATELEDDPIARIGLIEYELALLRRAANERIIRGMIRDALVVAHDVWIHSPPAASAAGTVCSTPHLGRPLGSRHRGRSRGGDQQ